VRIVHGPDDNCSDLVSRTRPSFDALLDTNSTIIYISKLPVLTLNQAPPQHVRDAVSASVDAALSELARQDKRYVIDASGHSLSADERDAATLFDIFWNADMTRTEKLDKIIDGMMAPHNIDVLVAGQMTQADDTSVSVRLVTVIRSPKQVITERRTFRPEDFQCKDSKDRYGSTICEKAVEEIYYSLMMCHKMDGDCWPRARR
jgi:hypothetical protein